MIERHLTPKILDALAHTPAVAMLGPRQVGKTTLALAVGQAIKSAPFDAPSVYLDLQSPADVSKLAEPELYLSDQKNRLVILDEVHRMPALFPVLRGLIDKARRAGHRYGQYLLLGSASVDLLKQSGESLAGRITYLELAPLTAAEAIDVAPDVLWLRGGFPESVLAKNAQRSLRWREDFIRTYLERDVAQFMPRIATETMRRLWIMLAHRQGTLLNIAELARSLAVDAKTVVDLMLVRRLPPWHNNLGKRLVRSPKVYVRDCGLVHALLGIGTLDALLSHPVVGASWETWVIENLLTHIGNQAQAFFYRTATGAEIDLLLEWPSGERWAIEIKRSLQPKLERGFFAACTDLKPTHRWVVYPGTQRYRMDQETHVLALSELIALLLARTN
jgi:uncharacterized protein